MSELNKYKAQTKILKAMANETRLLILDKLKTREHTVKELTDIAGLDQSTISKHLSILSSVGIVDSRKEGNLSFYRLLTPCVLDMFGCTSKVIDLNRLS